MSFWSPLTRGVYHPGQSELLVQRVQSANETRLGFSTLSIASHQSDPARSEPTRFFFMDGLKDQVGSLETLNADSELGSFGWLLPRDCKKMHEKARQSRTCGAWRAWRSCRFVWLVLFVYFKFVFIVVAACLFFFSVIQFMSKSLLVRQARPYFFDRTLTTA